jgi:hypothetical protein
VEGLTKASIISCPPELVIPLDNVKGSYGLISGIVVSLTEIHFSIR